MGPGSNEFEEVEAAAGSLAISRTAASEVWGLGMVWGLGIWLSVLPTALAFPLQMG
jgi:hypothetical protein